MAGALFRAAQIRFFLLQNRQGKTRLSKWYVVPPEEADRLRMEAEIHRTVTQRDRKYTNFVEVRCESCYFPPVSSDPTSMTGLSDDADGLLVVPFL